MTRFTSSRRMLFLALTALSAACSGTEEVQWGPAPSSFPKGAELAVIQGNPAQEGQVFTVRLRMPNDYLIPPHFHPEDEHVTVLQGTFQVGLGTTVGTPAATLHTSGFITAPAGVPHWGRARGQTVVQVHGIGPFKTTYVQEDGEPIPGGGQ
ncbi:MAG: cupin domain-containing protein [Gemmatimonadota bacterium]